MDVVFQDMWNGKKNLRAVLDYAEQYAAIKANFAADLTKLSNQMKKLPHAGLDIAAVMRANIIEEAYIQKQSSEKLKIFAKQMEIQRETIADSVRVSEKLFDKAYTNFQKARTAQEKTQLQDQSNPKVIAQLTKDQKKLVEMDQKLNDFVKLNFSNLKQFAMQQQTVRNKLNDFSHSFFSQQAELYSDKHLKHEKFFQQLSQQDDDALKEMNEYLAAQEKIGIKGNLELKLDESAVIDQKRSEEVQNPDEIV